MEADPKRSGVKAVLLPEFKYDAEPGQCLYMKDDCRLMFACPGCGLWGSIRIGHPKPSESPSWDIQSGTPDDPTTLTVTPSIHCIGCCGWHGFLTNGVFISC